MKTPEKILQSRWLRPIAHLFSHPSLWHSNRRSVSRAVAIGLLSAFLVPIGQFAAAAMLALKARANVPIAMAATLVTNPITFPPIYYAAYRTGLHCLTAVGYDFQSRSREADVIGYLSQLVGPTVLGLLIFGVASASTAYLTSRLWFRYRLSSRWSRRFKATHA